MLKKIIKYALFMFTLIFIFNNDLVFANELSSDTADIVNIPDEGLEYAIRMELDIEESENITKDDMLDLTGINYNSFPKIKDLSGLEYATNLESLRLPNNAVSDLSPIKDLDSLKEISLSYNSISDIQDLSELNSLEKLYLDHNNITDMSPLENLPSLWNVHLAYNNISEVTPINNSKSVYLTLNDNNISDLTPLGSMDNLTTLDVNNNHISDISMLSDINHDNPAFSLKAEGQEIYLEDLVLDELPDELYYTVHSYYHVSYDQVLINSNSTKDPYLYTSDFFFVNADFDGTIYQNVYLTSKVHVSFFNQNNDPISDEIELTNRIGDLITVAVPKIDNYTIDHVKINDSQNHDIYNPIEEYSLRLIESNYDLKFYYIGDPSTIHVSFIDNTGKSMKSDIINHPKVGSVYHIPLPTFDGYNLSSVIINDTKQESLSNELTFEITEVEYEVQIIYYPIHKLFLVDSLNFESSTVTDYTFDDPLLVESPIHNNYEFDKWIIVDLDTRRISTQTISTLEGNMPDNNLLLLPTYSRLPVEQPFIDVEITYKIFSNNDTIPKTVSIPINDKLLGETVTLIVPCTDTMVSYEINGQIFPTNLVDKSNLKYKIITLTLDETLVNDNKLNIVLSYSSPTLYSVYLNDTLSETTSAVGSFKAGAIVDIPAPVHDGYKFIKWEFSPSVDTISNNENELLRFTMPASELTITPVYEKETNGSGSGSGNIDITPEIPTTFKFFKYDNISKKKKLVGEYEPGEQISVEAHFYKGYTFTKWETEGIKLENTTSDSLVFTMPSNDVTLKANYSKNPADLEGDMENPYIFGYPDGKIHPDENITRAEVVQILYNLYGENTNSNIALVTKFSDVNTTDWYSEALAFSIDYNLISGYPDGTFEPNEPISREELAFILDKFVPIDISVSNETNLIDVDNSWASDSIIELNNLDVITGYDNNLFLPKGYSTRAEVVTLTSRLLNRSTTWEENHTYSDLPPTHWAYEYMMNAANGTK